MIFASFAGEASSFQYTSHDHQYVMCIFGMIPLFSSDGARNLSEKREAAASVLQSSALRHLSYFGE